MESSSSQNVVRRYGFEKFLFQVQLMIWKRKSELLKQKTEILKITFIPLLFFFLLLLVYGVFDGIFAPDGIEEFIVPLAVWVLTQKTVVNISYEKSNKLQEALRIMGLSNAAYWASYFITDGIIIGFFVSFLCALCATGSLFNSAGFGNVLGLLFVYSLSGTSFAFFLCSFFDSPQTAGQAFILIAIAFYVIYLGAQIGTANHGTQGFLCLFPPIALQLGSGSFKLSYQGISFSSICGIMFADIFLYAILAWYFSQVWPTEIGVAKPWNFPFKAEYWKEIMGTAKPIPLENNTTQTPILRDIEMQEGQVPIEKANESILGKPTVRVDHLRKMFGAQLAVNGLSFQMYENQIFALLGHNGAGKTTTINMLTGLISPDFTALGSASIYGRSIQTEMDTIRNSMGVCPQHDVLFDNLTVREHILLASQLKGFTYEEANEEAVRLTNLFHLEKRLDHTGSELSGGQKRKLSVSLAICGGSKFIVLDEPTAGMDPLARRELWDLLASLRVGRTMLLTTHYMDEADILGDRIAIMSLGTLQCVGTSQFLKTTFGAGYKLIFDKGSDFYDDNLASLTNHVKESIPGAQYTPQHGDDNAIVYTLPFDSVKHFGKFFDDLEVSLPKYRVLNFGVTITSLEDVFLRVGEDQSVRPDINNQMLGIGSSRTYEAYFLSQLVGIIYRKLNYSIHDYVVLALVGVPICCAIVASILYTSQAISANNLVNDFISAGIYIAGYIGAAGLLAEFVVRERTNKLRNVLTVMGCDFKAYWIGTFIADYIILFVPLIVLWISWGAADISDFYAGQSGLAFFIFLLFNVHLISFSYICSYMFTSPKSCIAFLPFFVVFLIVLPNIVILLIVIIFSIALKLFVISNSVAAGIQLWGIMVLSPHGALFSALLGITINADNIIQNYPPVGATIAFMIVESVVYMYSAYYLDTVTVERLSATVDPTFDPQVLESLDQDVLEERNRALLSGPNDPLYVKSLRKLFPPKRPEGKPLVAVEDMQFAVSKGEIFGLLGANGAGKTTTLSMLTRLIIPTSGDAFISSSSILSNFSSASTNLGVVTQTNSLWDLLSVEDHLYLFARLRGVPPDLVKAVVEGTIDQLELSPHRKKLAARLSGGMKRKLCVAIALIGDPEVVLLDEPSAGLDPVSRRNLWNVILKTMSHRSVVLTTHSMEEAEALCARIGIMVNGQMRVLGTKQHLKSKFSSGYELVVKMHQDKDAAESFPVLMGNMTKFVTGLYPGATLISENGGLLTYNIPKEEMKIGKSFSALESSRDSLRIEEYSISQPTLEQVFIRTVLNNSEKPGVEEVRPSIAVPRFNVWTCGYELSEFDRDYNVCGCTNFAVKMLIGIALLLFVIFIVISFGAGVPFLFVLGIIALIISIIGCVMLCAPCCRKSASEE